MSSALNFLPRGGRKVRIAVLVSGRGSNMRALLDCRDAGQLANAEFVGVLSNNPDAPALGLARERGIPADAIDHRPFRKDRLAHEQALVARLHEFGAEAIVLAGYMRILTPHLIQAFQGRIINIHPALLPAFPGVDAQAQAVEYGVRLAGCTVHFVNEETDGGPIILQRHVRVLESDTDHSLSARILTEEHKALPHAIDLWTRGRLLVDGRRVIIIKGESSFPGLEPDIDSINPILIATGNSHKVVEIRDILGDLPTRLVDTKCFSATEEPVEDGDTYEANARIKARFWQERTGLWTLADDSGLEVDALDARPGIYSSRYAPTSVERNHKLLAELANVPAEKRTARFVCAVCIIGPNGEEFVNVGRCEGHIGFESRGEGGFGYDPVFVPDGFDGRHLAELAEDTKNQISHRSNALRGLREQIRGIGGV